MGVVVGAVVVVCSNRLLARVDSSACERADERRAGVLAALFDPGEMLLRSPSDRATPGPVVDELIRGSSC